MKTEKLTQLIAENPGLEIYFKVDRDLSTDDYTWMFAENGSASIESYWLCDERMLDERGARDELNSNWEPYWDSEPTDEQVEALLEDLPFKRGIYVRVYP